MALQVAAAIAWTLAIPVIYRHCATTAHHMNMLPCPTYATGYGANLESSSSTAPNHNHRPGYGIIVSTALCLPLPLGSATTGIMFDGPSPAVSCHELGNGVVSTSTALCLPFPLGLTAIGMTSVDGLATISCVGAVSCGPISCGTGFALALALTSFLRKQKANMHINSPPAEKMTATVMCHFFTFRRTGSGVLK